MLGLGVAVAALFPRQSANTALMAQVPDLALQSSYLFDNPRPLAPFTLHDQLGNEFTNQQLLGKWSLLFVGFTSCPDVCPTTLNKLNAAYAELQSVSKDIQVVFVSVDPDRDTQTKRLDYINFFNRDFKAVTAAHTELFPFTRDLGFAYAMVGDGADYQVDHSASYVLVSPKGEKFAVFKPKQQPGKIPQILNKELVADLKLIIESA
ncbi:electron transporter SenC [Shewanella sp. UCD-FRSSP16_17]|uniref:SCO family protein n=1 Tax=Shewanella sp. UCD-FRSSP16_17 TaxID=1853256 RepID=UPI0007EEEBC3|nr:SCO family protein [Shewanella sp. UCD-FRSSP16_17]OBT05581.1 electron transporter SenC [Shewanella sp. UCD-FRSSP16_17]